MTNRFCVFCGSSSGSRPSYRLGTAMLAEHHVSNRISIVYSGGNVGLMGVLADAALAQGGEVIGVIPRSLIQKEVAYTGLTDLRVGDSMH
jgi:predicted Rossmann-fold nucleotide-binding protein